MTPLPNRPVRANRTPRIPGLSTPLFVVFGAMLAWAGPLPAQGVAEVQVTPETMTLAVGQRQALFATAYDRQGNLIPNAHFTFWSSDTLVAKVGKDGSVVGVRPGLAKVEARVQGRQASTAILITGTSQVDAGGSTPGIVLTLEPAAAILLPGESLRLETHAQLEDGTPALTGRVRWKSVRPEISSVDSGGVVVGLSPGRSVIQATASGGQIANAAIEVSPAQLALSQSRLVLGPGESDTIRVLVPAQGNREVRGGLRWTSSDSAIVRVSPTGTVSALAPGRAEITVIGFGQEGRATATVHRETSTLVVTPRPAAGPIQLPVRAVRRITAVAEAADSTPIPEARISWQVGDTGVAVYDPARGELTGRVLGTTTLTARLYGFDPVVWAVQVIPGTLGLEPRRIGLGPGERDSLRAVLLDEDARPIGPASELKWSSDAPDVVQVSPGGVIDGLRPGKAVVTAAASWGKKATAEAFVVADLLLASNRGGGMGIYQIRSAVADTMRPVFADSFDSIQPALSPDRTRIVFSTNRNGSYDLYLMDADGRNLRRLTSDPGGEGEPVWAPDGSRIVFTATPRGGPPQLHLVRPDGKPAQALTAGPGGNQSPAVSPDGRSVAFISTRDGNQEIYLLPLDGGEASRVTRTEQRESNPRFLPNGDLLYVVERPGRSRGSRIVLLARTRGGATAVLETEEPIAGLAVSRDGSRIAYIVGRLTDAAKGRAQFKLFLRPLAAGSTPSPVGLRLREHVVSPSF